MPDRSGMPNSIKEFRTLVRRIRGYIWFFFSSSNAVSLKGFIFLILNCGN